MNYISNFHCSVKYFLKITDSNNVFGAEDFTVSWDLSTLNSVWGLCMRAQAQSPSTELNFVFMATCNPFLNIFLGLPGSVGISPMLTALAKEEGTLCQLFFFGGEEGVRFFMEIKMAPRKPQRPKPVVSLRTRQKGLGGPHWEFSSLQIFLHPSPLGGGSSFLQALGRHS